MSDDIDPTVPDDDAVARMTAHLAGLDFDAPTLELILAALTVDVCDHAEVTPAS